ncbi:MAG: HD domain-containing protein [Candidatus Krumholzibacteriia bacterium]
MKAGDDAGGWLDLLQNAQRLKSVPRSGWLLRGVTPAESVADHSWGTALTALLLVEMGPEHGDPPVDRARVLTLALLHDLPESVITDIPRLAARYLPEGAKEQAELAALGDLLAGLPVAASWLALWEELRSGDSPEARLVHDADRLELLAQSLRYAAAGNRTLDDFWEGRREEDFARAAARALFRALLVQRRRFPPGFATPADDHTI